jgi:hypothetical protein
MSEEKPQEVEFDVIAVRVYERVDAPGEVRLLVGRPEPDPVPGRDWRCRIVIEGLDVPIDRWAYGVDAIQAPGLAFELARIHLQPNRNRPASVSWLEQSDPGLPRLLG